EVDINKKTENQAKMTKLTMGVGIRRAESRPKSKNAKVKSIQKNQQSNRRPELKNTVGMQF
ncbi:hypothetical protein Tco_1319383, partial [Tanacetum coccineum]